MWSVLAALNFVKLSKEKENIGLFMSPVFPVFYTVTTVSWSQKPVHNDNIFSMILGVHVSKVWHLKIPFSVD